jgi:hypothetical protein
MSARAKNAPAAARPERSEIGCDDPPEAVEEPPHPADEF